ncbi:MAG: hypothetical protein NT066_07460 [Candidatus Omnitrophica bacterium]|nr:hypothetical protein [Candidatus Omnitrophota bacterium]
MPILPCFALISAIGIDLIGNKRVKNIVVIFVFSTGLMQYFSSSFTYRIDEKNEFGSKDKNINILYKPYLESTDGTYSIIGAAPPHRIDWRQEDIAKSFAGHIQELKDYPFIMGIICDENDIGLNNVFANRVMNYYVIKELMRSDAVLSEEIAFALNKKNETKRFLDFIADMQGVVYISKNNTWPKLVDFEYFFKNKAVSKHVLRYNPAPNKRSAQLIEPMEKFFFKRQAQLIKSRGKIAFNRLAQLIKAREKFGLIGRFELPYNYYANVWLYKIPEVKKDELSVKIFNGKIKIFFRDKEITKDKGVTSEFIYNNKTYKYNEAAWDFYDISPQEVRMVAEWGDLGVMDSASISMGAEKINTVNIKIELDAQKDITLDGWYMNSLISNEYKEWIRPFFKRVFKEISPLSDPDNFEPLDLDYTGPNIAGIRGNAREGLPALLFNSSDSEVPVHVGVSNTNYYHNSRCIYVTAGSGIHLEPGKPKVILNLDISILDDSKLTNFISGAEKAAFRDENR